MLVRKPYAFLIKNFRLIHGVLLFFAAFLGKKTLDIYDFYNTYVNLHAYYKVGKLSAIYVTPLMFVFCVTSFLVCLLIYFILTLKRKNGSLYLYAIIFYIALFVYFIFMVISFNKLQGSTFDVETVRVYRDISFIFLFPQLLLIILLFSRTIGFNLKQFEFKKDLEEMNIEVSDSEEVELTFGSESYKYARGIRKFLRLSKYFILENKLFVIIVSSILIFSLSVIMFTKINVYADRKFEKSAFVANGFTFDITDSYMTSIDRNNEVIKKNKYYLLVKVNIRNNTTKKLYVNRETFRLAYKNELLYPDMSLTERFKDIGNIYKSRDITAGMMYDCYVVFELDKSQLDTEYIVNVLTSTSEGYKEKIVKPVNIDEQKDNGSKSIPNEFTFTDSMLGNTKLILNSYEVADKFMERYTYDFDGQQKTGTYAVMPDISSRNGSILKIESSIEVDKSTYSSKFIEIPADLFKYYGFIKFRALGETKEIKLSPKDTIYEKNKFSYFEVPSSMKDADKIELILLIRGQKYTFILK